MASTNTDAVLKEQKEELLNYLAVIGVTEQFDLNIGLPDADTPLADMYFAVKVVAENVDYLTEQLKIEIVDSKRKADLIEQQSAAILELSTPVTEIWDGILVMPLIGTVDTARAQQIIDALLDAIAASQASCAIIDITGVPVIDTEVADHLLKTVSAAKMLGADVILSGVSPHNAQTLVKLGVDLSAIATKGSLKAALQLALTQTDSRTPK